MLIEFDDCLVELLYGFEDKEAIVDIERRIEAEGRAFGGGILAD